MVEKKYDVMICGDFNAKITGYLCTVSNKGGEEIRNITEMGKLKILNDTKTPTRREANEGKIVSSIIDFTLMSE